MTGVCQVPSRDGTARNLWLTGPRNSPGPDRQTGDNDPQFSVRARHLLACRHYPDRPARLSAAPGRLSSSKVEAGRDKCEVTRLQDTPGTSALKSPVSDGIKNKLKSRTHLPSLSLKVAANVRRADPEGQVWSCHMWPAVRKMTGKNYSGFMERRENLVSFRVSGSSSDAPTERAED